MEPKLSNIAHYRILAKLGEGGMGLVYRAEDTRLGRHVALKVLQAHRQDDARAIQRFNEEARAIAALDHPHICTLYDFGEAGGLSYLAMQFIDGESLRDAIARGPLDEERSKAIVLAIAAALEATHARGILHRDVKSDNVLLGSAGEIKLADFGLARITGSQRLTSTSTVLGTPAYVAPEILRGDPASPASDQFSLAVLAYECVTGELPFQGSGAAAVMYAISNVFPDPPTRRRPGVNPAWNALLMRALEKEPGRRWPDVAAFARAVESMTATGSLLPGDGQPPPASGSGLRSLAVLFFENLSNDPANDYFCDGLTEDLLTDLAKVPGLQVASRNAVMKYRGTTTDVRRIASELGVAAVVEGRVRRVGDRLRITAQLVDPRNDFHLWAERYDRSLEDVFAVQEEIAEAIAAALGRAPSDDAKAAMRRARPRQVEAYDLYLRGRESYRRYTREDVARALECFEQAVAVDPGYSLAWAGVADCCGQMIDKGWDRDPRWRDRGLEAARRSITLDPRRPEGHKAQALFYQAERETEPAVAALRRALECDPTHIPALINLAQEYLSSGDFAGAERALRQAASVDPAYGLSHLMLALVYIYTRRGPEAIAACHRAQNSGASPFHASYAYAMRAHAYVAGGDLASARQEIAGGRAAGLSARMLAAAEALVEAHMPSPERARALLAQLATAPPEESYGCELAAAAAGVLGDSKEAVRFLRAAEAIDKRHPPSWRVLPEFRGVRGSAEFSAHLGARGRSLVWPLEAAALPEDERSSFDSFREASGLTGSSGV